MEVIVDRLDGDTPTQVSFVNADCVNIACRSPEYLEALQQSDLVFADGIGVRVAGDVLGQPVRDNVNGTDLFPLLAAALQGTRQADLPAGRPPGRGRGRRSLAGQELSRRGIGRLAARLLLGRGGGRGDRRHPPFSGADLVLVAFGAPRQELWIRRNLSKLGAKVVIGVGGLLGFLLRPHSPCPALGPQAGHGVVLSSLPGAPAAMAAIPRRQRRLPRAAGAGCGWRQRTGEAINVAGNCLAKWSGRPLPARQASRGRRHLATVIDSTVLSRDRMFRHSSFGFYHFPPTSSPPPRSPAVPALGEWSAPSGRTAAGGCRGARAFPP